MEYVCRYTKMEHWGKGAAMIRIVRNITLNDLGRFYRSIIFTILSDIVNFLGIFIVIIFLDKVVSSFINKDSVSLYELLGISALGFVYMIVYYYLQLPAYKANYKNTYELSEQGRLKLAEHLRKLPLGFLESSNPARLSHSLMNDIAKIEMANSSILPQTLSSLILACLVFVGLCFYHWQMALAFFSCVPFALLILLLIARLSKHLSHRHHNAVLYASNIINEYIDGITTIKAHNMSGEKFKRVKNTFDHLRKESIRIEVSLMPFVLSIIACIGAGIGVMVVVGRDFLVSGEISIIEYIAFLLLGSKAFVPLTTFATHFVVLEYFSKAGENILNLYSQNTISGNDEIIPKGNDITLENVSFSYGNKPVLHNINIHIKDKTSLAIVGESGSGKSTLVKLIARFYEPTKGRILLGDESMQKNIATLDYEKLMQKFSMVFQKVYLFEGSIASNLTFAKGSASKKEMYKALKDSNALEFIDKMPNGLESHISEGGKSLSGGQKQRISIARCLLKDAPIVLLDEISSNLDVINEYALQKAMSKLTENKSVVIIAHKIKSIQHCDCIVVLQKTPQGSIIAEQGTHTELLSKNGLYAKAWADETKLI